MRNLKLSVNGGRLPGVSPGELVRLVAIHDAIRLGENRLGILMRRLADETAETYAVERTRCAVCPDLFPNFGVLVAIDFFLRQNPVVQDGKFIAAVAVHFTAVLEKPGADRRKMPEVVVAGDMAVCIVDKLEFVKIQEQ